MFLVSRPSTGAVGLAQALTLGTVYPPNSLSLNSPESSIALATNILPATESLTVDTPAEDDEDELRDVLGSLPLSRPLGGSRAPSLYAPQGADDDMSILDDFFATGDGRSALHDFEPTPSSSAVDLNLTLVTSRLSEDSLCSGASKASKATFLPSGGGFGFSLEHLCRLIDTYPSLQQAEIFSSECYTERIQGGVLHRFVVLELHRRGKKVIWARLDRMRLKILGTAKFLRAAAQTRANDVVQLAASKGVLIPKARSENLQKFNKFPTLGELHHLLRVICAELTTYKLWPQNCWFFVSLLQQHLGGIGEGIFLQGHLPFPNLDPNVRTKVHNLVQARRAEKDALLQAMLLAGNPHSGNPDALPILTSSDIATYLRHELEHLELNPSSLGQLAEKAQGSFIWAVTAYRFVAYEDDTGVSPRLRLNAALKVSEGLKFLYTAILEWYSDLTDPDVLARLLALPLFFMKALPLAGLLMRVPPGYFPPGTSGSALRTIAKNVSCIVGRTPQRDVFTPRHHSLVDFLGQLQSSSKVSVLVRQYHRLLAMILAADRRGGIRDPPADFTAEDIVVYLRYALRELDPLDAGLLAELVHNAQSAPSNRLSFVWIVTACRYVTRDNGTGTSSQERLQQVCESARGLDSLYTLIMQQAPASEVLLPVLRLILYQDTPVPFDTLTKIAPRPYFPPGTDSLAIQSSVQHLVAVLSGTHTRAAAYPYHSSFADYLTDEERSGTYFVDVAEVSKLLALSQAFRLAADTEETLPESTPDLSVRHIAMYARYALRNAPPLNTEQCGQLVQMAAGSFVWIVTACRFIVSANGASSGPSERLSQVCGSPPGLNGLYAAIIHQHPRHLIPSVISSLLGLIICAGKPLSLVDLVSLAPEGLFPIGADASTLREYLWHLPSILCGTRGDGLIDVYHISSLAVFLGDQENNVYFVNFEDIHKIVALRCFHIMSRSLRFNIANLPTSFLPNRDIPHIDLLIAENIPSLLLYCCQFWAFHSSFGVQEHVIITLVARFLEEQFLEWLEVMSLTQSSPETALTYLNEMQATSVEAGIRITDVLQFVKSFAVPIATSVAHIYLSALVFAPAQSKMLDDARHPFSGIPQIRQGRLQNWPSLLLVLDGHSSFVSSVAVSPDGSYIASGSDDSTVCVWDAKTGRSVGEPLTGHTTMVTHVVFSPDGSLIASGSGPNTISLWDAKTGEAVGEPFREGSGLVYSIAFSSDGRTIASGSSECTVSLWDVESGTALHDPWEGHSGAVWSVAFSPDDIFLASGSSDHTICIWDVATGSYVGGLWSRHSGSVLCVAFSPDGQVLASASQDRTIRLWDVRTGDTIGSPWTGHSGPVTSLAFSPSGAQIASGSGDQTVRIWDTDSSALIGEPLRRHAGTVYSVAFSPDGTRITSGSADGTVCVWDAVIPPATTEHAQTTSGDGDFRRQRMLHAPKRPLEEQLWEEQLPESSGQQPPTEDDLARCLALLRSPDPFILKDGWVVGPKGELLLWVPPAHRKPLDSHVALRTDFSHTLDASTELDFRDLKCGRDWAQCRALPPLVGKPLTRPPRPPRLPRPASMI